WGFQHRSAALFYIFYVWVSIFGAVTASQFWLLANYAFNAREARRLFGWLALGGILGGIFGGTATRIIALAPRFGTESLLAVVAALLVISFIIVRRVVHIVPAHVRESVDAHSGDAILDGDASPTQVFGMVRQSRHLSLLMVVLTLSVIVEALIDY